MSDMTLYLEDLQSLSRCEAIQLGRRLNEMFESEHKAGVTAGFADGVKQVHEKVNKALKQAGIKFTFEVGSGNE